MSVKISVTGVKEIDAVLKGLPLQLNHKILGQAHADAAKPLVDRAKLLAPEGPTGNLVDSIGVEKTSLAKATEVGAVTAGPRRGGRNRGYAAHLVEFGTRVRRNKKGANRGVMPKKPFMEPAFTATKSQVEGRIAESIGKKLIAFMKKTLK
jgi:HK97 gp10 family phage protein